MVTDPVRVHSESTRALLCPRGLSGIRRAAMTPMIAATCSKGSKSPPALRPRRLTGHGPEPAQCDFAKGGILSLLLTFQSDTLR